MRQHGAKLSQHRFDPRHWFEVSHKRQLFPDPGGSNCLRVLGDLPIHMASACQPEAQRQPVASKTYCTAPSAQHLALQIVKSQGELPPKLLASASNSASFSFQLSFLSTSLLQLPSKCFTRRILMKKHRTSDPSPPSTASAAHSPAKAPVLM